MTKTVDSRERSPPDLMPAAIRTRAFLGDWPTLAMTTRKTYPMKISGIVWQKNIAGADYLRSRPF
eukprot:171107-Pyramimonas_sp.AAC.2